MLEFRPSPGILVVTKTDKKRTLGSVTHYLCRIVNVHYDNQNDFPMDALVEVRHEDLKPLYDYPINKPSENFTVDVMNVDGYYGDETI